MKHLTVPICTCLAGFYMHFPDVAAGPVFVCVSLCVRAKTKKEKERGRQRQRETNRCAPWRKWGRCKNSNKKRLFRIKLPHLSKTAGEEARDDQVLVGGDHTHSVVWTMQFCRLSLQCLCIQHHYQGLFLQVFKVYFHCNKTIQSPKRIRRREKNVWSIWHPPECTSQ